LSEITINFNSCKLEKPINDNIESDFYLLVKASREDKTILEDIFGSFLMLIPGLLFLYGGGLMFKTRNYQSSNCAFCNWSLFDKSWSYCFYNNYNPALSLINI
jgi:hypothetical protein